MKKLILSLCAFFLMACADPPSSDPNKMPTLNQPPNMVKNLNAQQNTNWVETEHEQPRQPQIIAVNKFKSLALDLYRWEQLQEKRKLLNKLEENLNLTSSIESLENSKQCEDRNNADTCQSFKTKIKEMFSQTLKEKIDEIKKDIYIKQKTALEHELPDTSNWIIIDACQHQAESLRSQFAQGELNTIDSFITVYKECLELEQRRSLSKQKSTIPPQPENNTQQLH